MKNILETRLTVSPETVSAFCRKWKIQELSLFGSVLRGDFRANSDIDFLARFSPDAQWSLWDRVEMQQEFAQVLGRPVDIVNQTALERSANFARKQHILEHAQVIYAA